MRYLLGRTILSLGPLLSFALPAQDKSVYSTNKGERVSYSWFYMKDRYGIEDGRNTFKNLYGKRYGTLMASYDRYFHKKGVNLSWGFGMGLGHNQGNPKFVSQTDSDIIFRLYTLLLEASLAAEVRPSNFLKLMVKAGPSMMGLYRSRNDLDHGERGKNIYQFGVGAFAHGIVKIDTGGLFPSWKKYLYKEYKIYGLLLNFGVRYQYYGKFKNSRINRVDGLSYLVGLSFEFL